MKDFRKLKKLIFQKVKEKSPFLVAIILLVFFLFLGFLLTDLYNNFLSKKVLSSNSSLEYYPVLNVTLSPQISAKGAVILDANSKVVLYSKNPNLRFSSASTAKIMTALTSLEYFDLNDVLTVKTATKEGSVLGLKVGQKLTFENLLYGLLLPSANDAAYVLAQNYPGGENSFVRKMNERAKKLNLFNTKFADPSGLLDDEDYTTPLDLSRLASSALKNQTFAKVVSTKQKIINDLDGEKFVVNNLNKLLGTNGVYGVKTGTTLGAGQVLVTSKKIKDHTIIIVVMDSRDRFKDTEKLLNLTSGNITYLPIHR